MKILFINSLYEPNVIGGAETILRSHVNALHARGVEVAVLTLDPKPGLRSDLVDGVRVWRAGLRNSYWPFGGAKGAGWRRALWHALDIYNPLMASALRQVLRLEAPDLVCTHNLTGWSVAAWSVLSELGIPTVHVLHDPYLLCPRSNMFHKGVPCLRPCLKCRAMRLFHPGWSNQVAAVVGVSRFILEKAVANGCFSTVPIRQVINNARDMGPARIVAAKRPAPAGQVTFGYIGSLLDSKGIELLLESFVREAPQGWRLVVAGSGKEGYVSQLKQSYRHDRITFLGRVAPELFFNQVDCTVVPSLWPDTFPGVVLESFFFGVPVLGSRRGGIPEMIIEGENGVLFDPEQPGELVGAMVEVAARIDFWRGAAPAIRESAGAFFDLPGWTERWLSLYRRVISAKS
jgi:glycosyltransferase involved in cell wall biosynthesis